MREINNVILTNSDNEIVHPQTSIDQVYDKENGKALDTLLRDTIEQSKISFNSVKNNVLFSSFNELGKKGDFENIDDLVSMIPRHATVIHRKTKDDIVSNEILPTGVTTGILTVHKDENSNVVSFKMESLRAFHVGYYYFDWKNERWSGWFNVRSNYVNDLSLIGLKKGEETLKKLYESLPNDSILKIDIQGDFNSSIYPENVGLLEIFKGKTRARYMFTSDNNLYFGSYNDYYDNIEQSFKGWKKLTLEEI